MHELLILSVSAAVTSVMCPQRRRKPEDVEEKVMWKIIKLGFMSFCPLNAPLVIYMSTLNVLLVLFETFWTLCKTADWISV